MYLTALLFGAYDIYEELSSKGERYYLDGLYNCTEALHQYYRGIMKTGKAETDELKNCVQKAMKIKNYEIANIWSC